MDGTWRAYRQAAPDTAPLFHAAGEPFPSQRGGRWHRQGEGYAQNKAGFDGAVNAAKVRLGEIER